MMREVPVLNFIDPERAQRRLARSQAEAELAEWLRAQARDRQPDGVRGGPFWYLVSVGAGNEIAVAIRLLRDRVKAYCPRERVVEKLRRKKGKRIVRRPMYPGYIFVQLAPGEPCWAGLLTYDGVRRILPATDRPVPVSDATMAKIQRVAQIKAHRKRRAPTLYVTGEEVRVCDGPFASWGATVVSSDDRNGRVKVEVGIMGREVPIELELDQIEKLG